MSDYRWLRIAVFDHDRSALHGLAVQIKKDCRVLDCVCAKSPEALKRLLQPEDAQKPRPEPFDFLIIDAEASFSAPSQHLDEFLRALPVDRRRTRLICLTNTSASDLMINAIKGGAHGLFLKEDVIPGLVHAALRAREGVFLYSESLREWVPESRLFTDRWFEVVPHWESHPALSLKEAEVMYACLIEGEDNAAIAQRLYRSEAAIEKALCSAYDKVIDSLWYSTRGMEDFPFDAISRGKQAYLFYTGLRRDGQPATPPKKNKRQVSMQGDVSNSREPVPACRVPPAIQRWRVRGKLLRGNECQKKNTNPAVFY